ncbi:MAG: anti-sigma factor [Candidatus Pacebacteria bacterium]|nr:anti-sigma factor [Candidatus Paceibacterota bacterium]
MKKLFFLSLIAISLIFTGCLKKPVEESASTTEKDSEVVVPLAKEDKDLFMEYQFKAVLEDVADSNSSGFVMAKYDEEGYQMIANFSDLPETKNGDFYEGWIVRKSPFSVISTGAIEKSSDGSDVNIFSDNKDLSDHLLYVLTLEPDDGDPAPAEHILEGTFQPL